MSVSTFHFKLQESSCDGWRRFNMATQDLPALIAQSQTLVSGSAPLQYFDGEDWITMSNTQELVYAMQSCSTSGCLKIRFQSESSQDSCVNDLPATVSEDKTEETTTVAADMPFKFARRGRPCMRDHSGPGAKHRFKIQRMMILADITDEDLKAKQPEEVLAWFPGLNAKITKQGLVHPDMNAYDVVQACPQLKHKLQKMKTKKEKWARRVTEFGPGHGPHGRHHHHPGPHGHGGPHKRGPFGPLPHAPWAHRRHGHGPMPVPPHHHRPFHAPPAPHPPVEVEHNRRCGCHARK